MYKPGDYVLILESVFPQKVDKIGEIKSINSAMEYPFEIAVCGSHSQFKLGTFKPISIAEIVRRANGDAL